MKEVVDGRGARWWAWLLVAVFAAAMGLLLSDLAGEVGAPDPAARIEPMRLLGL